MRPQVDAAMIKKVCRYFIVNHVFGNAHPWAYLLGIHLYSVHLHAFSWSCVIIRMLSAQPNSIVYAHSSKPKASFCTARCIYS